MNGRPTAEIVADLRNLQYAPPRIDVVRDGADRLTELDAKLAAANAALDRYEGVRQPPIGFHELMSTVAKAVRP